MDWRRITTFKQEFPPVLLANEHSIYIGFFHEGRWVENQNGYPVVDPQPTHWMRLPAMPRRKS